MKVTNPNVQNMEIKGTYPGHITGKVIIRRLYSNEAELDKCQTVSCVRCILCGSSNSEDSNCFGWFNISKYFDKEINNGP